MEFLQLLTVLILIAASIHVWNSSKRNRRLLSMVTNQIKANESVRRTLAMGLHSRFKKREEGEEFSELFIRQTPEDFEHFVANIYVSLYGGDVNVTPVSGDFGVDIEHRIDGKLFYIQVKCEKNNLPFDAIAKVHSNMVKHGADGGAVVNASDFSRSARKYAEGLNVDLVNGVELVKMWIDSLESQTNEIKKIIPET